MPAEPIQPPRTAPYSAEPVFRPRTYRGAVAPAGLTCERITIAQTDLLVCADRPIAEEAARLIIAARTELEDYIATHPRFTESFVPLAADPGAPAIVERMCAATASAGVGPMASVAGEIAEYVARGLVAAGCSEAIVENGGDVFVFGEVERVVALFSGDDTPPVGIALAPELLPCAVATSSGRIGHSASLGEADAVAILAPTGALADAVATAVANRVRTSADIDRALEFARSVPGITGALVAIDGALGAWGAMRLVPIGAIE